MGREKSTRNALSAYTKSSKAIGKTQKKKIRKERESDEVGIKRS